MSSSQLYPHQQSMLSWMQMNNRGIVFADMGLGKTFTSLEYIRQLGKKQNLVICSKILIQEWINQITKFYPNNEVSYFVLHNEFNKTKDVSIDMLKEYDIIFTTYQYVVRLDKKMEISKKVIKKVPHPEDNRKTILEMTQSSKRLYSSGLIYGIMWNSIFLDECHIATNYETATFRSIYSLNYEGLFGLSGTPLKNNKKEMFSLLNLLKVFAFSYPIEWSKSEIPDFCFDLFYKLTYEQTDIQLPPLHLKTLNLSMSLSCKETYIIYLTKLIDLFKAQHREGIKDMSAILGAFTRLRQIALEPYLLGNTIKGRQQYAEFMGTEFNLSFRQNGKQEQVKQIVQSAISMNEKVIVFSAFTSYLEELCKTNDKFLLVKATDTIQERHAIIELWKTSPNYHTLLTNYRIGAEGLNLIEGNHIIILDTWWNFVYEKQCIARAHRIGQQKPVHVYRLITSKSIEELMLQKSTDKIDLFHKLKNKEKIRITPLSHKNLEMLVHQNIQVLQQQPRRQQVRQAGQQQQQQQQQQQRHHPINIGNIIANLEQARGQVRHAIQPHRQARGRRQGRQAEEQQERQRHQLEIVDILSEYTDVMKDQDYKKLLEAVQRLN